MALCMDSPSARLGGSRAMAYCRRCVRRVAVLVGYPSHDAVSIRLVHCWLRLGLLGLESRSIHQRGRIELLQSDLVSVRLLVAARLDSVSALLVRSFLFSSPT